MKNLFGKLKNKGTQIYTAAAHHTKIASCRTQAALSCSKGEGFVDTAVKILIAVVIGALILAGLYLLFSGTILPELTRRIQDMFNYRG